MPHSTLKLQPGVDQNRTLALNEAAISNTQFVRFVPDRQGLGLVQKLGGWAKWFTTNMGSIIRAMWAWEDTNSARYLGVGSQSKLVVVTGLVANGTTIVVTYTNSSAYPAYSTVGETVVLTGFTPSGYNGKYQVASFTVNTVTLTSTTSLGVPSIYGTMYAGDGLSVIYDADPRVRQIITPRDKLFSVAVQCRTQSGSPYVIIDVAGSEVTNSDTVYIKTQISVGGLVLFGLYPCTFVDGATLFQITATDTLGNLQLATSTVGAPGGGAVPQFTLTTNSPVVTITLADHGFETGDTFTVIVPVTAAAVTIYGNYIIQNVLASNQFTINASNAANGNATVFMNNGNAIFDIYKTPGAVPSALGYGVGGYGVGGYGTGVVTTTGTVGDPIYADDWTIDNWGQILVACPIGGPVFTWDPLSGILRASIITDGPPVNDGVFVAMPQQQIIAWGSTFTGIQDPLLIRWSDVGDYETWLALPTNQAGSYRMPKGSRIVGCIQGPQQGLVWTDLALWAMQYVGPPYVYQFNEIGTGCGLISRKAATSMNGVIYWMGQSQFFKMGAGGVEMITCPIWDVIFQDLDTDNLDNVRIAANSYFGEVTWYYPTISGDGEPTKYAKYNVILNQWDFGTLTRTAWINQSVLGAPLGAGPAAPSDEENYVYQHEVSPDADGTPMVSSFQTGYFAISDGEWKVFVDQIWPDMKWGYYNGLQDADLTITFYVADYPHQTAITYGPYAFNNQTNYITPRFRGRLMSIKMESSDIGSFWRIGATRYRFQQDGKF
jgi:hypothetical protein